MPFARGGEGASCRLPDWVPVVPRLATWTHPELETPPPGKARPPDSGIASRPEIVKLWRVLQQGDRPWEIETNNARNRKNPKNRRFQNRRPEQKTRPTTLWAFSFASPFRKVIHPHGPVTAGLRDRRGARVAFCGRRCSSKVNCRLSLGSSCPPPRRRTRQHTWLPAMARSAVSAWRDH